MRVFVWKRIDTATRSYHSEGGLVVFADTEERARELANEQSGCHLMPEEAPDEVREVVGGGEMVFIMPDKGCC